MASTGNDPLRFPKMHCDLPEFWTNLKVFVKGFVLFIKDNLINIFRYILIHTITSTIMDHFVKG